MGAVWQAGTEEGRSCPFQSWGTVGLASSCLCDSTLLAPYLGKRSCYVRDTTSYLHPCCLLWNNTSAVASLVRKITPPLGSSASTGSYSSITRIRSDIFAIHSDPRFVFHQIFNAISLS